MIKNAHRWIQESVISPYVYYSFRLIASSLQVEDLIRRCGKPEETWPRFVCSKTWTPTTSGPSSCFGSSWTDTLKNWFKPVGLRIHSVSKNVEAIHWEKGHFVLCFSCLCYPLCLHMYYLLLSQYILYNLGL